MNCPKCGCSTFVVDSRLRPENVVKRRRTCQKCGYRFNTFEITNDFFMDIVRGRPIEEHKHGS